MSDPVSNIDIDGRVVYEKKDGSGDWVWYANEGDSFTSIGKELGFSKDDIKARNPEYKIIEKFEEKTNNNGPQNECIKAYQWGIYH